MTRNAERIVRDKKKPEKVRKVRKKTKGLNTTDLEPAMVKVDDKWTFLCGPGETVFVRRFVPGKSDGEISRCTVKSIADDVISLWDEDREQWHQISLQYANQPETYRRKTETK